MNADTSFLHSFLDLLSIPIRKPRQRIRNREKNGQAVSIFSLIISLESRLSYYFISKSFMFLGVYQMVMREQLFCMNHAITPRNTIAVAKHERYLCNRKATADNLKIPTNTGVIQKRDNNGILREWTAVSKRNKKSCPSSLPSGHRKEMTKKRCRW